MIDLDLRERLDLPEDRAPHVTAEAHAHLGAPVGADDRCDGEDERDEDHQAAGAPDVVGVAPDDAVVHDVGVELREVQVRDCLREQQHDDERERAAVRSQVAPEQVDHRYST